MSLPLQLMLRKLHHLQRWEDDIQKHLVDCLVEGRERAGTLQEKKECLAEMEKLNKEIADARKLAKRKRK